MKYIGYITTALILMFFSAIYSGYVLTVLWDWFVVPTFKLPSLTIPTAIGVALIVSYLARGEETADKDRPYKEVFLEATARAISKPTFALLIGWIVLLFS